jgi:hypothetical protein
VKEEAGEIIIALFVFAKENNKIAINGRGIAEQYVQIFKWFLPCIAS